MPIQESLEEPVSRYMSKKFTQVNADDSIHQATQEMKKNGSSEAVVMDRGAPAGIITEHDILYKVVASGLDPQRSKARDVMSSPLQTIGESAKVADAISKMSTLGLRRLGVTHDGKVVGMITQKAVVSGGAGQVPLPELVVPDTFYCPYCNAALRSREELSKHIDRTHMGGAGLLEGDTRKW